MKHLLMAVIFLQSIIAQAQVNLQTGSAVVSIPVYDYKDNKSRLNLSVSLSYNSGNGLKVDQAASNIGQGWGLTAGGVITRMQVGQPDDQQAKDNASARYPAGYLYNSRSITDGCPVAQSYYPIYGNTNTVYKEHNEVNADREIDYFSFQINGRNGLFVLDKGNKPYVKLLGDSKVKISYTETDMTAQGIRTTISSFTIQDENGFIYRFNQKGTVKILRTHFVGLNPDGSFYVLPSQPNFAFGGIYRESAFDELALSEDPYIVNNWYLSEIEDPLTHRKINFTYTIRNINTAAGKTIYENELKGGADPYIILSYHRSIMQVPVITEIDFPDAYKVSFSFWDGERRDVKGDYPLKDIDIVYQDQIVNRYRLEQNYLGTEYIAAANSPDNRYGRLYLNKIRHYGLLGQEQDAPFSFEYYTGSGAGDDLLPPSNCDSKDIWGYYNGDYSGIPVDGSTGTFYQYYAMLTARDQSYPSYTGSYVRHKPGYAKLGLLKKITYQTGGSLTYEYEQLKGQLHPEIGIYYGGVSVSKTIASDEQSAASNIITEYKYILPNGESSIWGMETPINRIDFFNYYTAEDKYYSFPTECDYHYRYPGIELKEQARYLSGFQQFLVNFSQVFGYVSFGLEVMNVILTIGSPDLISNIIILVYNVVSGLVVSCTEDTEDNRPYSQFYNFNLKAGNSLPVQFSRVEVRNISPGINNGKIIHEFTSPSDYPILHPTIPAPYSQRQRLTYWAYGSPKKVIMLDQNNNPVHETEYIYDATNLKNDYTGSNFLSCKCEIKSKRSKRSDQWGASSFYNQFTNQATADIVPEFYGLFTGILLLKESYQREYKNPTTYLETKTSYFYNPNNYLVNRLERIVSNGDKEVEEKYYSVDYNVSGPIQTLQSNNIINFPVAEYGSVVKSGSTQYSYLSASIADLISIPNGDIRPGSIYEGRSEAPIVSGTSIFNATNPLNYPGLTKVQTNVYNSNSELEKTIDEGNRTSTYLYDYEGRFLTATVINAASNEVAYTSFETSNNWNWEFLSGFNYYENDLNAPTGNRVYYFSVGASPHIRKTGLNASRTYIVSFWTKESTITVNTQSLPPVFTANGWSFFRYEVSGVTEVNIAGGGFIDEVRLYPKNSLMSTSTYDPIVGKTSECDENNRILYYTYNMLGELIMVQDQNRNAVKVYDYNLKFRPFHIPAKKKFPNQ